MRSVLFSTYKQRRRLLMLAGPCTPFIVLEGSLWCIARGEKESSGREHRPASWRRKMHEVQVPLVTSQQDLLVLPPLHLEQDLSLFHVHLEDVDERTKQWAKVALVEQEGEKQELHPAYWDHVESD